MFQAYLLPWDTKVAELLRADDQKRENTKGNQRQSGKKAKADFPTYANSNLQKEPNYRNLQYLMVTQFMTHTHTNESPGFFF